MLKDFINKFLLKLNEYNSIAIFVHMQPDFDAYSSAFAIKKWIGDNFPGKKIYLMIPDSVYKKTDRLLFNIKEEIPSTAELKKSLAIIVDTPNKERILTQMYVYCKEFVIIDHHPKMTKSFAQLEFVDPTYPATAQILAEMLFLLEKDKEKKYKFSSEIAQYLYAGIITDTNNLMSLSVLPATYKILSELVLKGLNRNIVHKSIFLKSFNQKLFDSLVIKKTIFSNNGLAFSIINKRLSSKYDTENISNIVDNLENIHNVEIWSTLYFDFQLKKWKSSIRSTELPINQIAKQFGGGGHKTMSAVVFNRKSDYYKLLLELDEYLKNSGYINFSKNESKKINLIWEIYRIFGYFKNLNF